MLPALHAYTNTSECGTVVSPISSFAIAISEAADKYDKPAARYGTKLPRDVDDVMELRRLTEVKDTTTDEMESTRKHT